MIIEDSHTVILTEKAIQKLNGGYSHSINDFSDELISVMYEAFLAMNNRLKTKDEMRLLLGCYNDNKKAINEARTRLTMHQQLFV